jgi:hypothetical protein
VRRAQLDPARGTRATAGHAHIDERDVGLCLGGDEDRLRGIRDRAGELECRLRANDARERLANALVVLGDEHADAGAGLHTSDASRD